MKRALQFASAAIVILTLVLWLATGAHMGWSRTSETVMKVDPITELEYPETRKKLVAGVEVLAVGMVLGGFLAGAALLVGKPKQA